MTKHAHRRPTDDDANRRQSASAWSPVLADCAARIYGIDSLGDQHWKAIGATREEYLRSGSSPDLPTLCNICGLHHSELAELFPEPCNSLYALAGVPAPRATGIIDPTPATADAEDPNTNVSPETEE